jgi:photosystem II stability/assembly factor-like uncharacterized protein
LLPLWAGVVVAAAAITGPNVNQWIAIGPEGGEVLKLLVDPQHPSTIYAATCGGGIFKTEDAAVSWTALNSGLPTQDCARALVIDPLNPATLYMAGCQGVFKTIDGGTSWNPANTGLTVSVCIDALAINPQNSAVLYVAISDTVFTTIDGGSTWSPANSGLSHGGIRTLEIDPLDPNTIYAYSAGRLFKTTDGGTNWNPANSGLPSTVESLAIDPQNSARLYAGTQSGIFESSDGGASWNPSDFQISPPSSLGFSQVVCLRINPQTPDVIYALVNQFQKGGTVSFVVTSTDGGAHWFPGDDSLPVPASLHTIALDTEDPDRLYIGGASGVLKTTDRGRYWNAANTGLKAMPVNSLVVDSSSEGMLYAVNAGTGLHKSVDGGETWTLSNSGLPAGAETVIAGPQEPRTLFVGGWSGLFKSIDAGTSWLDTNLGRDAGVIAISPQNPQNVYVGSSSCWGWCNPQVLKSIDGGHTWITPQVVLAGPGCCSGVAALAVDPQDPNTLFAGGGDYNGTGSGLWKSPDGGLSWTNLNSALGIDYGDIFSIAIDPQNPNTVYVQDGKLLKSTDGGESWIGASSGLPSCCMYGPLAIDSQSAGTVYSAGYDYTTKRNDVFKSTDGGKNWTSAGSGLMGFINSLTIDPQNSRRLYAGTTGGLFVLTREVEQP